MDLFNAQVIAVLVGALTVAWLVARVCAKMGLDVTGIEAIVLGLSAGPYGQEVVSNAILTDLSPALSFALGTLGLSVGLRLRIDDVRQRPHATLRIAVILALLTATLVGAGMYALIVYFFDVATSEAAAAAGVLTAAALLAAPGAVDEIVRRHNAKGPLTQLLRHVASYSEILGVFAFGLLLCIYHVGEASIAGGRPLVPMEWTVIAISVGGVIGMLFVFFLGSEPADGEAFGVAILGMVLVASGVAYALNLSPLLICMVMGLFAANLSPTHERLRRAASRLERPMLVVVLFFAATAWRIPPESALWILLSYLGLRAFSRWLASQAATLSMTQTELPVRRVGLALWGQGGLVVAIAVNSWQVYDDALSSTVLTCLLVSGFLTELPSLRLVRNVLIDAGELSLDTESTLGEPT